MNKEILKQAGIDYDFGVKRFVGRAHLFEKALMKFTKDSTFSRICAAYDGKDKNQLLADTHEFKGVCGNIGLTSLYKEADDIVQMLRGNAYTESELLEAYNGLTAEYQKIYGAVVAAMEAAV